MSYKGNESINNWESYFIKMQFDTKKLSESLGIKDIGIIDLNLEQDDRWNCFSDDVINYRKNTTFMYWNNLTEDEKKERLKNHGMTGKKHKPETIEKMKLRALGSKKPTLHKEGSLIKDDIVINFSCLSHFCKEHGLSVSHVCEVLNGKRKSVKGWRKYNG